VSATVKIIRHVLILTSMLFCAFPAMAAGQQQKYGVPKVVTIKPADKKAVVLEVAAIAAPVPKPSVARAPEVVASGPSGRTKQSTRRARTS